MLITAPFWTFWTPSAEPLSALSSARRTHMAPVAGPTKSPEMSAQGHLHELPSGTLDEHQCGRKLRVFESNLKSDLHPSRPAQERCLQEQRSGERGRDGHKGERGGGGKKKGKGQRGRGAEGGRTVKRDILASKREVPSMDSLTSTSSSCAFPIWTSLEGLAGQQGGSQEDRTSNLSTELARGTEPLKHRSSVAEHSNLVMVILRSPWPQIWWWQSEVDSERFFLWVRLSRRIVGWEH